MADFYALTDNPLPKALHGADADFSIRTLSDRERLAIEDCFSSKNENIALNHTTTAVIVPQSQAANTSIDDFAILIECALGILTISGFQPIGLTAILNSSSCTEARRRGYREASAPPKFPKKVVKAAASTWIRHFFTARRKTKDLLHITADRFVRYLRQNNSHDALLDLCICLESLIESQTEIAFRFAMCLAKISGLENPGNISVLLSDLYDLRSRVVHGSAFDKEHQKVKPNTAKLRLAARTILAIYILYLTEHTKKEWKEHLKMSLLS